MFRYIKKWIFGINHEKTIDEIEEEQKQNKECNNKIRNLFKNRVFNDILYYQDQVLPSIINEYTLEAINKNDKILFDFIINHFDIPNIELMLDVSLHLGNEYMFRKMLLHYKDIKPSYLARENAIKNGHNNLVNYIDDYIGVRNINEIQESYIKFIGEYYVWNDCLPEAYKMI